MMQKKVIEQTFSQKQHKRYLGKGEKTLLDILNNEIGKMEMAPRKFRFGC